MPPTILNGVKSKCKWASNGSNVIWRWDEFTIKMVSKAMHIYSAQEKAQEKNFNKKIFS